MNRAQCQLCSPWLALQSLYTLYLTFLKAGTAEELFPLYSCKGYSAQACQIQCASFASHHYNLPQQHSSCPLPQVLPCARPPRSKGSRAKGTGRTGLAPHTPRCSFDSVQCSIPKFQMHCKQERCNHLSLT